MCGERLVQVDYLGMDCGSTASWYEIVIPSLLVYKVKMITFTHWGWLLK